MEPSLRCQALLPMVARPGLAALALATACTSADTSSIERTPQNQISDELHSNGTAGFFWLPPVVPRPAADGDVLPTANPTVRIDRTDAATGQVRVIARFTTTSGPVGERVRLKLRGRPCDPDDTDGDTDPGGYFVARWHSTRDTACDRDGIYRVRVFVAARGATCASGTFVVGEGCELGYADVDVVRNAHEFRTVDRNEFVPLIRGETLRIKFRIDRPALDQDGDGTLDRDDPCPYSWAPTDCGGSCVDLNNSRENCGACGRACPAGMSCGGGVCVVSCVAGQTNCQGTCRDLQADNNNCGACGRVCPAGRVCAFGDCQLYCPAGERDCNGTCCPNSMACDEGLCQAPCPGGETHCGGQCVSLGSDPNNCGYCGNVCPTGQTCQFGPFGIACQLACPVGQFDCGGHCADLISDPNNCNYCGHACPSGWACTDGLCQPPA